MLAPDALTLAVELGKLLEAEQVPYAVGGALALGIHGVSRSTQDVALNVFVKPDQRLSCFKLLFFRPKDLMDLERLVATAISLDAARVRALIVEAMGPDDERVRAWDDIVARFSPP